MASSLRLFITFYLNDMRIRSKFLKTVYIIWDLLVDCCITGCLLDSYWLNMFIIYFSQIDLFNIFPRLFRTFYLSDMRIRYEFSKAVYIVWDSLIDCYFTWNLLDLYWLNILITYFSQIDFFNIFPRLFGMFYLSHMRIKYKVFKTVYIIWDFLVDCCITRSLLDSYCLNMFITYYFQIDLFNIIPKFFGTFYLSEISIRYTFLKTRYIVWEFFIHCCITGSLLYSYWLNMLISYFS